MEKREFINYLESKNHTPVTIDFYTKCVERFFEQVKKEDLNVTKPDILSHLEHLKSSRKMQNSTRKSRLTALNHYFTFLYQNEKITENPCLFLKIRGTKKRTLYRTFTTEELDQLFDNFYHSFVRCSDERHLPQRLQQLTELTKTRNALILSVLIYQGVVSTEIHKIELCDLNLTKGTIKIRNCKRHNTRILPLKPSQIGFFINYLQNIRPRLLEYRKTETEKLFVMLPEISRDKNLNFTPTMLHIFKRLAKKIRTIEHKFIDFRQLRTSVITNWLKTDGLRKTQYFAGHRWISSTEAYLPNNLDNLTNDINRLHPF